MRMIMRILILYATVLMAFALILNAAASDGEGPCALPEDAPKLQSDKTVVVLGTSVSVRKHKVRELPAWTGGPQRVPPQCNNGQNVFFRIFEILNDHENMRWRRLDDRDWARYGEWQERRKKELPYGTGSPRMVFASPDPKAYAEIRIPAGFEKLDLIYNSGGGKIAVLINGKSPGTDAIVDTAQSREIPPGAKIGTKTGDLLDSHGNPLKIRQPSRGIGSIVELRKRYTLDPKKEHTFRVQKATDGKGTIAVWGVVYWRGNCVQVVQRAKSGMHCGGLPHYHVAQEVLAVKPDYVLMESFSLFGDPPAGLNKIVVPGFNWCSMHKKKFKTLIYAEPRAGSTVFLKYLQRHRFRGSETENAKACLSALKALCSKHGFPLVDVGPVVDEFFNKYTGGKICSEFYSDKVHPGTWGAACFGQAIYEGIRKHRPELPVRPVNFGDGPAAK
jgi:hypothetical protein